MKNINDKKIIKNTLEINIKKNYFPKEIKINKQ